MRRLGPLLVSLVGAAAVAAPVLVSNFSETQTCTAGSCSRAAPASNAEGAQLYGVGGFRLSVCAANGQTLSGGGTLLAWFCDSVSGLCMRNPSLDVSVTASSVQCQVFPDFQVTSITYSPDTVVFQSSSVTVSGGASVTVRIYPFIAK